MRIDIHSLDNLLLPLFVGFICLNFLDVYTTLLALNSGTAFRELNPIAAVLFGFGFPGFLLAMVFKYLPTIPLFYAVFAKDTLDRYPLQIRIVKLSGLIALVASNLIYIYIVVVNNIPLLVCYTI